MNASKVGGKIKRGARHTGGLRCRTTEDMECKVWRKKGYLDQWVVGWWLVFNIVLFCWSFLWMISFEEFIKVMLRIVFFLSIMLPSGKFFKFAD